MQLKPPKCVYIRSNQQVQSYWPYLPSDRTSSLADDSQPPALVPYIEEIGPATTSWGLVSTQHSLAHKWTTQVQGHLAILHYADYWTQKIMLKLGPKYVTLHSLQLPF